MEELALLDCVTTYFDLSCNPPILLIVHIYFSLQIMSDPSLKLKRVETEDRKVLFYFDEVTLAMLQFVTRIRRLTVLYREVNVSGGSTVSFEAT